MADAESIKAGLRSAFRDFRIDGVPASGEHEPVKRDIRDAITKVADLAQEAKDDAASAGTTILAYTRAELDAKPGPFEKDARAEVRRDPAGNVENGNGVYRYSGTAWVWRDHVVPPAVQASVTDAAVRAAREELSPITRMLGETPTSPEMPGVIVSVTDPQGRLAPFMRADGRLVQLTQGGQVEVVPTNAEVEAVADIADRVGKVVDLGASLTTLGMMAAVRDPEGRLAPFMRNDGRLVQLTANGVVEAIADREELKSMTASRRAPMWRLIENERPVRLVLDPDNRVLEVETMEGSLFVLGATGRLERLSQSGGSGAATVRPPEYLGQPFDWGRYQTLHAPAADVCLILLTMGQSNATGVNGTSDALPGATPVYPDDALMLSGASPRRTGTGLTLDTAPLKEAAVSGERETAATSLASHLIRDLEAATGRRVRTLSAVAALGGRPYRGLSRGSAPYEAMLATVRSMAAVCRARGWIPVCPGVDWMQGESDSGGPDMSDGRTSSLPASDYVRGMRQFARQLSGDIRAITGQAEDVPLFISHLARSAPTTAFGLWYRSTREAQRELHGDGLIRLVGAGYPFDFTPDGLHLASSGQNGRGQQVARAVAAEAFGQGWSPVIDRAHRWISATQLEVEFEVPTLPLVIDDSGDVVATTELEVTKGFHFDDGSTAPPSITSVVLQGDRAVRITLSAAPAGFGSCRVGYALNRVAGSTVDGRLTGARGLLRDSASHPSAFGQPAQSNWCVSFIRDVGRP